MTTTKLRTRHVKTHWEEYQDQAADFYRTLGLNATVNQQIEGVRGIHKLDVFVQGAVFGIPFKWVVECKDWKSNIPKAKVLVLASIIQDVGADKGFLLSEVGFQSGAIRVARNSNITLSSIADLRDVVKEELEQTTLAKLHWRAANVMRRLWTLHRQTHKLIGDPVEQLKNLIYLEPAFGDASIGIFPTLYGYELTSGGVVKHYAETLEELLIKIQDVIEDAEDYASTRDHVEPSLLG